MYRCRATDTGGTFRHIHVSIEIVHTLLELTHYDKTNKQAYIAEQSGAVLVLVDLQMKEKRCAHKEILLS